MDECRTCQPLLVGLLDGELTPEEAVRVNEHLLRCAACRSDHDQLAQEQGRLDAVRFTEPQDEAALHLWRLPHSRTARNGALFLVIGGYLLVLLAGIVEFVTDPGEWSAARIGMAAIFADFAVLLGLVGAERLLTWRRDPYREIER